MKKLEELHTNLSHIQTCQTDGLDSIIRNIKNKDVICPILKIAKERIYLDVPLSTRLDFFGRLNAVLLELMKEYSHDENVFHLFFDLMSVFKDKIDSCPQEDCDHSEEEWLELEKSVYLLCEWEDCVLTCHSLISNPK